MTDVNDMDFDDGYCEGDFNDVPRLGLCEVCHYPLVWNGVPTHNCPHPPKKISWYDKLFGSDLEPYCKLCGHFHSAHVKWPDDTADREAWRRLATLVAVDYITGADPLF